MNWRKLLLSLTVAAGLTLTFVPRASADPWFWHQRHDRYERRHDDDRSAWFSHWRYDRDDGHHNDRDGYRPYRYYDHR